MTAARQRSPSLRSLRLGRDKKRTVDLNRARPQIPLKLKVLQYLVVDIHL